MFWKLFNKKKKRHLEKSTTKEVSQPVEKQVNLIRFFRDERADNKCRYHKDIKVYIE